MGRTMGYLDSPADDQIRSIFDVVKDYTYALDTLDNYDYQDLEIQSTSKEYFRATYENAMDVIRSLKALLFNRWSHWSSYANINQFKHWYLESYLAGK